MVGSCEDGNDNLGSMNVKFLDQLMYYQHFKKDPDP